jgi:hypothetical protein
MKDQRHTWFVSPAGKLFRVCTVAHNRGGRCHAYHAVPGDALWSGVVEWEFRGDLFVALKEAKKDYRAAHRRWLRRLVLLRNKTERAAPLFGAYARTLLDRHARREPLLKTYLDELPASVAVAGVRTEDVIPFSTGDAR